MSATAATTASISSVAAALQEVTRAQTEVALDLLEVENQLGTVAAQQISVEEERRVLRSATQPAQTNIKLLSDRKQSLVKSQAELVQKRASLLSLLSPAWRVYMDPPLNIELSKPHARYVAKYVPLSVALQRLKDTGRRTYLQNQLAKSVQLLQSIRTKLKEQQDIAREAEVKEIQVRDVYRQLLRQRGDPERDRAELERAETDFDKTDDEDSADEKNTDVMRRRFGGVEEEKYPTATPITRATSLDIVEARARVQAAAKRTRQEESQMRVLDKQLDQERLNMVYYFRVAVSSFLPPFEQLIGIGVWWEFKGFIFHTPLTHGEFNEGDRANIWSTLTAVVALGNLLAIVIRDKISDQHQTIYPNQESILVTDLKTVPLQKNVDMDAVLERVIKLPQENANPDFWALLTNALSNQEKIVFWTNQADPSNWYMDLSTSEATNSAGKSFALYENAKDSVLPLGFSTFSDYQSRQLLQVLTPDGFVNSVQLLQIWKKVAPTVVAAGYSRKMSDFEDLINHLIFVRLPTLAPYVDLFSLPTASSINKETSAIEAWQAAKLQNAILVRQEPEQTYHVMWCRTWLVTPTVWLPSSTYKAGDLVTFQGKTYSANIGGRSPPDKSPSSEWKVRMPLADEFEVIPCFASAVNNTSSIHVATIRPRWSPEGNPRWACMYWSAHRGANLSQEKASAALEFKDLMISSLSDPNPALSSWRGEVHYINATGGCEWLIRRPGVSRGAVFVNLAKRLSHVFNLDFVLLDDASRFSCPGTAETGTVTGTLDLRVTNVLKEGLPWYSRFGFLPFQNLEGLRFIDKLARLPWDELRSLVLKSSRSDKIVQAIEAMSCATAPACPTAPAAAQPKKTIEATSCPNNSMLRQTADLAARKVCSNFSAFIAFFRVESNVKQFLKQADWEDEFDYSEVADYFRNLLHMVWIRRLTTLDSTFVRYEAEYKEQLQIKAKASSSSSSSLPLASTSVAAAPPPAASFSAAVGKIGGMAPQPRRFRVHLKPYVVGYRK